MSRLNKPLFTRVRLADSDLCPCGYQGKTYGQCCAPLHRGERRAETAVELMRSRYSAYAAHEADYIWQTWHARNRPELVHFDDEVQWIRLEIVDAVDGGVDDREGVVEFRAYYRTNTAPPSAAAVEEVLAERSRFVRRGKRWVYLDGTIV